MNCTKLPSNSQICFIDDQNHNEMYHENVLYINLKPYNHNINFLTMASKTYDKYYSYFPIPKSKEDFINYIANNTQNYKLEYLNKSKVEYNIEQVFGNVLIKKIEAFLNSKPRKFTKKNRNKFSK